MSGEQEEHPAQYQSNWQATNIAEKQARNRPIERRESDDGAEHVQ